MSTDDQLSIPRTEREAEFYQLDDGEMFLNLGPQHPSTHGVLRIALQLDGLENEAASALGDLLRKINTGLNIQRELVALMNDISHRDDISIARLIEQDDIDSHCDGVGLQLAGDFQQDGDAAATVIAVT